MRQWVVSFSCALRFLFAPRPDGGLRFARVNARERQELEHLVQQIAAQVGRALERWGCCSALRVFAEWNPVSALVQSARELFGNVPPGTMVGDAWPAQNPIATISC